MNKNIVKIIAVAAGAVSILACNKVSTYTPAPYAVIDSRSIEVEESEAGKLIQIPVYVYNRDGECSVTYTFEEGSAKNGKHFTPANTSGVLNFPAGTDTLAIEVKVIGEPGTYTGNQDFTVKLKGCGIRSICRHSSALGTVRHIYHLRSHYNRRRERFSWLS